MQFLLYKSVLVEFILNLFFYFYFIANKNLNYFFQFHLCWYIDKINFYRLILHPVILSNLFIHSRTSYSCYFSIRVSNTMLNGSSMNEHSDFRKKAFSLSALSIMLAMEFCPLSHTVSFLLFFVCLEFLSSMSVEFCQRLSCVY